MFSLILAAGLACSGNNCLSEPGVTCAPDRIKGGMVCITDGQSLVVPPNTYISPDCMTCGTVTTPRTPGCDDGWALVMMTNQQPMCAREFRAPHY